MSLGARRAEGLPVLPGADAGHTAEVWTQRDAIGEADLPGDGVDGKRSEFEKSLGVPDALLQ